MFASTSQISSTFYDLKNDPFFKSQRVRCRVTYHNDMGHYMPRLEWYSHVDAGMKYILKQKIMDEAKKLTWDSGNVTSRIEKTPLGATPEGSCDSYGCKSTELGNAMRFDAKKSHDTFSVKVYNYIAVVDIYWE